MDTRFFPHALKCDNVQGRTHTVCHLTHTLCVISHTETCCSDCCPLTDPWRQQSLQLSCSCSVVATIAPGDLHCLGESHTFGSPCALADLAFSRHSSLLSNPLVYLVFWWVKIFTIWIGHTVQKKPTVFCLIANYSYKVSVIKASLYSPVYST